MTIKELLTTTAAAPRIDPNKSQDKIKSKRKQQTVPTAYPTVSDVRVNHRRTSRSDRDRHSDGNDDGDGGDSDSDSDSDSDGGEPPKPSGTGKLHLDRRAAAIADAVGEGSNDDLLTTVQVANWLGVSPQWLEIGRGKNYGPPFMRLAPQVLRYKRGAVIDWLKDREYAHTWQYTDRRSGRAKKSA